MKAKEEKILDYFRKIASFEDSWCANNTSKDDKRKKSWVKAYEKTEIKSTCVIKNYLNPNSKVEQYNISNKPIIFPFGVNWSQMKAVKNAIENKISIIEGPPGTGKTQTILNIIANLLIENKSILIISNNNDAVENIKEKLSKYSLDFLVAFLGSSDNKDHFLDNQSKNYPDQITKWNYATKNKEYFQETFLQLEKAFSKKDLIAKTKQELSEIELEFSYFQDINNESNTYIQNKNISSKKMLILLNEYEQIASRYEERQIPLFPRIKFFLKNKIKISKIQNANLIKNMFYKTKIKELKEVIEENEKWLSNNNIEEISQNFIEESSRFVAKNIYSKYSVNNERKLFESDDLWKGGTSSINFIKEYPIVLSTTTSSFSTLNKDFDFDYVIIDEASQVRILNTIPILSRAKNLVVVGDTKQLPEINEFKEQEEKIYQEYKGDVPYFYNDSDNSFLKSIITGNNKIKRITLREHYRCHPKIINFCNKKFYNNELILMKEDKGEEDVLKIERTVKGNHAVVCNINNKPAVYNPREIETIKKILESPSFNNIDIANIAIISPYRLQCEKIDMALNNKIEAVSTVHKMQGKEKSAIIFSTTANQINRFVDQAELLNVAISRAKDKFVLVTNGNQKNLEKSQNSRTNNINDLIEYIKYMNKDKTDEEIRVESIFDLLYSEYNEQRESFLKNKQKISKYDSENIFYALLKKILKAYPDLKIIFEYPLNLLIKNKDKLIEHPELMKFASNSWSHIDFIIYNNITKRPILGIEVDGHSIHSKQEQMIRDTKKDEILKMYNFPLLRLSTKGSEEERQIKEKLEQQGIYSCELSLQSN